MFYQTKVKFFFIICFFNLLVFPNNLSAEITIEDYWARVTPSGSGSVYMKIINSSNEDDRLLSASSDQAGMVMIHRSIRDGDISKMIHVHDGVFVPKKSSVKLRPGDYHLMLMNINEDLSLGDKITVTLNFEKNNSITINPIAKLRPPNMHNHK